MKPTPAPRHYYVFYFDLPLEGEQTYAKVLKAQMPHRLQKYYASAYAGATSIGRGWGKIYIPERELDRFMALTGNRLAPEPEMYTEGAPRETEKFMTQLRAALRGLWPGRTKRAR